MRTKGISLIEVLMTLALLTITLGATLNALIAGLSFERKFKVSRDHDDEITTFEDGLGKWVQGADLSDGNSVFVSPIPAGTSAAPSSVSGDGLDQGASSLVLTTWNAPPPQRFLDQSQNTWESLNSKFGPQGGVDEIALSLTPVGDAGLLQGLFLREQRPPQPDPSQGGIERLLSPMIKDIRFEFYDGTNWLTAWDSRSGDEKGKLPLLVRITYLRQDEKLPHSFTTRVSSVPRPTSGSQS